LGAAIGEALPATLVWTHPDVAALAAHLLERWQAQAPAAAPAAPAAKAAPDDDLLAAFDAALDDIDDLI
ncbi:MAG: acyl carrier protein, partial [Myxococcales bacterium]|nr:acyl carrier protein [Myxococcales bacterium]